MINNNKDLDEIIDSIFSLADNGLAIVNRDGDILKSNLNFNQIFSSSSKLESDSIYNYIKNFSFENIEKVYTIKNIKIDTNIKTIVIIGTTYYIIHAKELNKDELLKIMYEATIHSLTDGIHIADTNGKIRIYNKAQGKIEGYETDEVLNNKVEEIYKLDKKTSLLLKVQREKKSINNVRQTYYTQNGNRVDVVTSVVPLFYKNELIGSAAIVQDYSQMHNLIEKNIEIEKKISGNKKGNGNADSNKKLNQNAHYNFSDIITKNRALLEDISWAKLSAKNDSNVLIYGETGTGKELFAQSIHSFSERRNYPFLALNCAAIPETLLESLLFGTTKGSFTGAIDKAGLFEQADGGTIFLDEINSMPMMLQAKLLRVLEEKKVMRLGDNKNILVDVRIISSCNQNPRDAIKNNIFRNDLFFRLSVMYLRIPPLRERKEDIDLLCQYYIKIYNEKFNKNINDITEKVRNLFYEFDWPGNVRELRHVIESAMNVVDEDCRYIDMPSIPKHIMNNSETNKYFELKAGTNTAQNSSQKDVMLEGNDILQRIKSNEYSEIVKCLIEANGNVAQAAKIMGISRQKMHYRIKKYHIK